MRRIALYGAILMAPAWTSSCPSEARADWQYVRWGMTAKAAVDASKGEARIFKSGDQLAQGDGCLFINRTPIAIVPKKMIGEFQFAIKFCAVTGQDKVTSIVLFMEGRTAGLKRTLLSQYGKPIGVIHGDMIWNDLKTGNAVTFSDSEVSAKIEYKKLGAAGL